MAESHDFSTDVEAVPGEAPSPENVPDIKSKSRQRLLRGIQRVTSSPSLTNLRRTRSASSPYKSRGSLSCASLAATGPVIPASPQPSPLGAGSSLNSLSEFPFSKTPEDQPLSARRVDGTTIIAAPTTAPLPADIRLKQDGLQNTRPRTRSSPKPLSSIWSLLPHEVQIHILSYLTPKELVLASRVSKYFQRFCFDGQLWTSFDASEFYTEIPAETVAKIVVAAGPFIKSLNLRGCVQVEHFKRTELVVNACTNLANASLEGCRNLPKSALQTFLRNNAKLARLDLTGLASMSNSSCRIIAENCPQLQKLNVSWCEKVDSRGIKAIVEGCPKLKDLRAGEVAGFDNQALADAIFRTNNLERLVLTGCAEITDAALEIMMHGEDPERDILTDIPMVPLRKLRHLDLSRCTRLTDDGIKAIGHVTPDLQGLQLSGCKALTDAAIEPILASAPRLTLLELEDLEELTNNLLSEHLARAPCASTLEHLSLSYCENVGDVGVLPVMQKCTSLLHVDLDNTKISDLVLAEAAYMVNKRSTRTLKAGIAPQVTLKMAVYDCQNVTWTGIREVLYRNTEIQNASQGKVSYPTEAIALKCFYGYQPTVNEHQKRVFRGDLIGAGRLERKWADYMQAEEEANVNGAGYRRRRRRAREAHNLHLSEEDGVLGGRRRARTMGSCSVM